VEKPQNSTASDCGASVHLGSASAGRQDHLVRQRHRYRGSAICASAVCDDELDRITEQFGSAKERGNQRRFVQDRDDDRKKWRP
jgi:hypothetical protein